MTETRLAAISAAELSNPDPAIWVAAHSVMQLQQMHAIVPADARLASEAAHALGADPAPLALVTDASVLALIRLPDVLPDNGRPFQWHTPDPERPGEWLADDARSDALSGWQGAHGRKDPTSHADPSSVTAQLDTRRATAPELGEVFRIVTSGARALTTGRPRVRFTGEVTDLVIAGTTVTVTAVGRLARAGRRDVDPRGFPRELDGARVYRILTAAGAEVGAIDGGAAKLLPSTAKAPASTLLDVVVDSTDGVLLEQSTGEVDWQDAEHRRGAVAALELDATELLSVFTWTKRTGDRVNRAEVVYGAPNAAIVVADHNSIDAVAVYPEKRSTLLVEQSAAYDLGNTIVGRRAEPSWQLPSVVVDLLRSVPESKRAALLALRPGDRVTLTGLPPGGDFTTADLFVEGVGEAASVRPGPGTVDERTTWTLTLSVSDPALSGVQLRWIDAPAATTWANVDPALSWLDLARAEDPAILNPLT